MSITRFDIAHVTRAKAIHAWSVSI